MKARLAPADRRAAPDSEREDSRTEAALGVIQMLASEIGPRRPCSEAEHQAGRALASWLRERGAETRLDRFNGFPSFAYPFGLMLTAALAGGVLQSRRRRAGDALSLGALAAIALEGDLRVTPVSALFARQASANVVASVAPSGEARQRVCLCAHMDTTRSGLIFHPRAQSYLLPLFQVPVVAAAVVAAGPVTRPLRRGRLLHRLGLLGLAYGLAMLAERELRGEDVRGASDNASGCAVAAQLAAELAAQPLENTRVDLLITGCEEVGMRGAQAYMNADRERAASTIFLNFDTVGGDVPLTYLRGEGFPLRRPASPRLLELAQRIERRRPDLGLRGADRNAGLPTDATVALARGHEAITFLAQGQTIPNYHWPTDTFENVAPATIGRALEAGREFLRELDRQAG